MNSEKVFGTAIIFILTFSILFVPKPLAEWAYAFVVWDDYVYVVTDEQVTNVVKEIGHVTKSSDLEGTYSGNFSNAFPKGTKYYSIQGINTDDAIAVKKEDGSYIKATRDGEYASNKFSINYLISLAFIGAILLVTISLVITNYYGKRRGE